MTDVRAEGTEPAGEDDRLPWLEAADEDDDDGGPSAAKLIAFVVIGLVAIGLVVGGLFWMGNRTGAGDGEPELIAAPEGDYKVKPDDPGGMKVKGEGDTQFAASEGAQPKGAIDTSRVPEAPVTKAPAAAAPTSQPKATPQPAPAEPAPAAAGGQTIQLGAFDSQAQANSAWKAMASRFSYLAPLSHSVMTAQVGGRTFYRLRASGAGARDICRRLEVAGESCIVVN
jgi:hypothetical protein